MFVAHAGSWETSTNSDVPASAYTATVAAVSDGRGGDGCLHHVPTEVRDAPDDEEEPGHRAHRDVSLELIRDPTHAGGAVERRQRAFDARSAPLSSQPSAPGSPASSPESPEKPTSAMNASSS